MVGKGAFVLANEKAASFIAVSDWLFRPMLETVHRENANE